MGYICLYLLGIFSASLFKQIIILILALFFFFSIYMLRKGKICLNKVICLLFSFILGFSYFYIMDNTYYDSFSDINYKNKLCTVVVTSFCDNDKYVKTFEGKVEELGNQKADISIRTDIPINYRDKIVFYGNVKSISNLETGYSFNNRKYKFSNKIFYKITGKNELIEIKRANKYDILNIFAKLKTFIIGKIKSNYSENSSKLLCGILLGEKTNDDAFNEVMQRVGLSHIVVVSGMHFSILIMFITTILRRFRINRKISSVIVFICSVVLGGIIGFTPSVARAVFTILFAAIADQLGVSKKDSLRVIILGLTFFITTNLYIIYNVGFILSYGSVIGILMFEGKIYEKLKILPNFLRLSVSTSVSAVIVTFPFLVYYFSGISIIFIVSNLIITPLVPVLMIFGVAAIACSLLPAPLDSYALFLPDYLTGVALAFINRLSALPISYVNTLGIDSGFIFVYYCGLSALFIKKEGKIKYAVCIILIAIFSVSLYTDLILSITGGARLLVFGGTDSGKVLIKTSNQNTFIDLSVQNGKQNYDNVFKANCKSSIDNYIISYKDNIDFIEKLDIKIKRLYCPEFMIYDRKYANILNRLTKQVIPVKINDVIKTDNLSLSFHFTEENDIGTVIIKKGDKELTVTNNYYYPFKDNDIVSYKMLKDFNELNFLNSFENEIRSMRI